LSELKAVILQCGNEEYAISVDSIVSIERLEKINRIPHLPEYMLGLMKIRGELVPILDLEQILYLRPAGESEQVRIVVVQTETLTI
jgi:purine-binding chemotaxis protein CheW